MPAPLTPGNVPADGQTSSAAAAQCAPRPPAGTPGCPPTRVTGRTVFDAGDRLCDDVCALKTRVFTNVAHAEYVLANFKASEGCAARWASGLPNLRVWRGYGFAPGVVDADSRLRGDTRGMTHGRERQQLNGRVFTAVPDRKHGEPLPEREAVLQNGLDTSGARECSWRLSERPFDTFHPELRLRGPLPERHVIPAWQWGGAPSRDLNREADAGGGACAKKFPLL